MHPALSVIVFSTASGAGYGLLVFLVLGRLGWLPQNQTALSAGFVLATVLICGGLLSSTFHLGRPERAWRAFSQWRSSWLSREGVMALVTFVPMLLLAAQWLLWPDGEAYLLPLGLFTVVCALLTVFTTSMIYASLKPIPAWHNPWTVPAYLILALTSGSVLYQILLGLTQSQSTILVELTIGLVLSAALVKILYWRHITAGHDGSTPETATGLGALGRVQQLQSPHSQSNYLLKEMGFKVARKHARRLRWLSFLFAFVAPIVLLLLGLFIHNGILLISVLLVTALSLVLGLVIERWLFFAEAKHTVTHYYHEGGRP